MLSSREPGERTLRRTFMRPIVICLISLFVIAGCGDGGDAPADTSPIEIAAVHERVEYYGACGNVTVTVDGVTYYPVYNESYPGDTEGFPLPDFDRYPVIGAMVGVLGSFAAPQVAPPGPGDDIGDMIVYVDGTARFESDSGWVIWLTDEEQTYGWVC